MNPKGDALRSAVAAHAETIRLADVSAELDAAMSDPLLQDIVDRALAEKKGLTDEQRAEAREALLLYFATDPRVERLLEEIRSGGGKSHVVESRSSDAPAAASSCRSQSGR